jgi:nucleotide-binding universal stress UspA family protein
MSYATLMVHVDVDGKLGGHVAVAAGLAERFHAHVIGVAGWAPMSVFLADEARRDPPPSEPHLQDMKTLLDQKGGQLRLALEHPGRIVEWRSVLDFPTEVIAREARAADLIIIGRERVSGDPFCSLDAGQLILKAGRPVLLVPPQLTSLPVKRVAVAWRDTREARRAVCDALPFLQAAESVLIFEVCEQGEDSGPSSVSDVEHYLMRHGVEVVTGRIRLAEVTVTETLLRMIETENIDLIVAGAYGHSRLGEWMFGGVTHDLLTASPICCLFSH